VLRTGYQGLGGGHHLEERALAGGGVGPDDGRAGAVSEQRLRDEGVEGVPLLAGRAEGGEGELDAGGEDARAAVVLGEVLGEAQGGAAGGAAVELERGAADVGAEAEERGEPEVGARAGERASELVATTRWVMSAAGRRHLAMAFVAAAGASFGAASATTSSRASREDVVPWRKPGWALRSCSEW
jgi:hypothetical protein